MDGCAKVTRTAAGKGLVRRPPGPVLRAYAPIPLDSLGKPQEYPVWFVLLHFQRLPPSNKPAKRFPGPAARSLACKAWLLGETLCRGRSPEPTRSAVLVFGVSGFTPWGHLMELGEPQARAKPWSTRSERRGYLIGPLGACWRA